MADRIEETAKAPAAPHKTDAARPPAHSALPAEEDTEAAARAREAEEIEAAQRKLPVWAGVLVILIICAASFWLALNPEWVMRFGRWGYVGAFLISAIASATIILPAPGIAVVIAMAEALDPVALGVVAGVGSAFGELTGYVAGASGRAFVPEKQRVQFERLHDLTNRYGAFLLFGLAAIPFPLFDFAGIISGMLRMNVVVFLFAVGLGKSIKYTIMVLVGAGVIQWMQQFFQPVPPIF
jgi:membrane protein YqaA with SNARE-associated domain